MDENEVPTGEPQGQSPRASRYQRPNTLLEVLKSPEGGVVSALWLGLILLVASFALKQIFVDWTMTGINTGIEPQRLHQKKDAQLSSLRADIGEIQDEIDDLDDEIDKEKDADKKKKLKDERKDLDKKKTDLQKEQEDEMKDIERSFRAKIRNADIGSEYGQASALGNFQRMMWLKFLLDIVKLLGALLVIFSSLHITVDPAFSSGLKTYAVICGAIALFACTCGGLLTLIA